MIDYSQPAFYNNWKRKSPSHIPWVVPNQPMDVTLISTWCTSNRLAPCSSWDSLNHGCQKHLRTESIRSCWWISIIPLSWPQSAALHSLNCGMQCISKLAWLQTPNYHSHAHSVLLQPCLITASECILKFTELAPGCVSSRLLDSGLHVHIIIAT